MKTTSFPISSRAVFAKLFDWYFLDKGAALIKTVKPVVAPVTFTTASNPIQNNDVRSYFMNSGSAQTLTIPSNLTNIAIGEEVVVTVLGAGVTTVAAGSGATVNKKAATLKSDGQYSRIILKKTAVNTWVVSGDLAAS